MGVALSCALIWLVFCLRCGFVDWYWSVFCCYLDMLGLHVLVVLICCLLGLLD